MTETVLQLRKVSRTYAAGERDFAALKDVNLTIQKGEWVAIMGRSGSGKSTLLNLLGLLDRPTAGTYHVAGQDVADLTSDELAALRRARFGFVFQHYNLLSSLTALANVEVPGVYAGEDTVERRRRARWLLYRFELADRSHYPPRRLSGGQQQRVSIARALMNGGEIILADEPTGALDSRSGEEVLEFFRKLHSEGHTIILVTHDPKVAAHAQRVIELKDGKIDSDRQTKIHFAWHPYDSSLRRDPLRSQTNSGLLREALLTAVLSLRAHRLRSFLSMLGIMIGVASVASVVALGIGSRDQVLNDIRALGTDTLDIYPGQGWGDLKAMSINTLNADDANTLSKQPYVDAVTPLVSTNASIRFGNVSISGTINGVGNQYFRVHPFEVLLGSAFSAEDVRSLNQVVVIDENARARIFGAVNPVGHVILIGTMPARVIGVAKPAGASFDEGSGLNAWLPYTSVIGRLTGSTRLRSITVRVRDEAPMEDVSAAVTRLLTVRHGMKDFFLLNTDAIRKSVESATTTMTLMISSIAVISLIVGGIGVMNIMLVSVTERTREIGIRMSVGARQRDIRQQFLIEATVICVLGGLLGVLLSLGVGLIVDRLPTPIHMVFSPVSFIAALVVSILMGVGFGYFPAQRAAALNPVDALGGE